MVNSDSIVKLYENKEVWKLCIWKVVLKSKRNKKVICERIIGGIWLFINDKRWYFLFDYYFNLVRYVIN